MIGLAAATTILILKLAMLRMVARLERQQAA